MSFELPDRHRDEDEVAACSAPSESSDGCSAANRQESARYRTIVADPPWDHSDGTGFNYGAKAFGGKHTPVEPHATRPPYEMMGVNEIASVMHAVTRPGLGLAERDCHLYMWTTSRYLRDSFDIIEEIGFSVSATLVWCKAPMGFMGGAFRSSVEFIQFARRGSLPHQTQADRRWFTWPRVGWTQLTQRRSTPGSRMLSLILSSRSAQGRTWKCSPVALGWAGIPTATRRSTEPRLSHERKP